MLLLRWQPRARGHMSHKGALALVCVRTGVPEAQHLSCCPFSWAWGATTGPSSKCARCQCYSNRIWDGGQNMQGSYRQNKAWQSREVRPGSFWISGGGVRLSHNLTSKNTERPQACLFWIWDRAADPGNFPKKDQESFFACKQHASWPLYILESQVGGY